ALLQCPSRRPEPIPWQARPATGGNRRLSPPIPHRPAPPAAPVSLPPPVECMPADSTAAPVAATAARPLAAPRAGRIGSIDLARGLAVCLMIVSHGTNGLMPYADFPDWGQVPVHVLTKFSSSLFFIVFGIALAVAFVPKTGAADWPQRRNHLIRRGLLVLLWYKLLTAVELWDRGPEAVVDLRPRRLGRPAAARDPGRGPRAVHLGPALAPAAGTAGPAGRGPAAVLERGDARPPAAGRRDHRCRRGPAGGFRHARGRCAR